MAVHEMRIEAAAFERIKKGIKILEIRLYDDKRRKIKIGDTIQYFKLPEEAESIECKVEALFIYSNFSDLMSDIQTSWIGYEEQDRAYLRESMYMYYTREAEAKYGVIGIKISYLKHAENNIHH